MYILVGRCALRGFDPQAYIPNDKKHVVYHARRDVREWKRFCRSGTVAVATRQTVSIARRNACQQRGHAFLRRLYVDSVHLEFSRYDQPSATPVCASYVFSCE